MLTTYNSYTVIQGYGKTNQEILVLSLLYHWHLFCVFLVSTWIREMTEKHGSLHAKTLTLMNELALVGGPDLILQTLEERSGCNRRSSKGRTEVGFEIRGSSRVDMTFEYLFGWICFFIPPTFVWGR